MAADAVYCPDELRNSLMPTLESLYQVPESWPFHQPVDPIALGLPDYSEIVTHPMDLSTVKRKLETGQYQHPNQYIEDVWLIFENAWLYNRPTTIIYGYCSKLADVFQQQIFAVMESLGCPYELRVIPGRGNRPSETARGRQGDTENLTRDLELLTLDEFRQLVQPCMATALQCDAPEPFTLKQVVELMKLAQNCEQEQLVFNILRSNPQLATELLRRLRMVGTETRCPAAN